MKNLFNIITGHFKRMSNVAQLVILLTVTTAIAAVFYAVPAALTAGSTGVGLYNTGNTVNNNSDTGIGGGSIKGNCVAGKKSLPIYCVDVESKTKTGSSSTENSGNTADNNNSQDSDNQSASEASDNQTNNSSTETSVNKYISISFDAAWGADDTIQILDILDKYNVKTTFFMTGGWVESYPDMVKEIYSRGHDLGNHSQNHKQMSKLSVEQQKEEIMKVSASVKELTGYDMFLFRPPYGDYNNTLINTVYSCNYYPIQWSVDSLDWKDYGVDSIIKTVTKHKKLANGAIVLMHNGAKYTAQALEDVIKGLQAQGYTIVPISQLIIRENFHMDANGMQIAD